MLKQKLLVLACVAALWPASSSAEKRTFRFSMYRNPPKPTLTLLPVQSRKLERAGRDLFNQALKKEAVKLECRLIPFPDAITLDTFGQLPPQALPVLREKYGIELVLQSRLEQAGDRNALYAEMIDTHSGAIKASFNQDCACQLGEMFLWMLPEAVRKLGFAMHMRPPTCPIDMLLVPAPVKSGEPDSTGKAWGPGAFCIDLYEYPNDPGMGPVSDKTYKEAEALCKGEGKRLCNEDEWQLACGGWDRLAYPYGKTYNKNMCNTETHTIELSGGHPTCKSPFGVFDMAGNLYEWTSSNWSRKLHDKVVRGGNWSAGPLNSGCADRFAQSPAQGSRSIGVRCCGEPQR